MDCGDVELHKTYNLSTEKELITNLIMSTVIVDSVGIITVDRALGASVHILIDGIRTAVCRRHNPT